MKHDARRPATSIPAVLHEHWIGFLDATLTPEDRTAWRMKQPQRERDRAHNLHPNYEAL